MNKTQIVKLLGLAGAILSGVAVAIGGNIVEGGGIIAAALSSANMRS